MASVPNNTTFNMRDVYAILVYADLASMFNGAKDICFDPAYSGSKNSLLNFRNYTDPLLKSSAVSATIPLIGGTAYITITSSSSWTSTKGATWFTVSPATSNSASVQIAIGASKYSTARTSYLTITNSQGSSITINVYQR